MTNFNPEVHGGGEIGPVNTGQERASETRGKEVPRDSGSRASESTVRSNRSSIKSTGRAAQEAVAKPQGGIARSISLYRQKRALDKSNKAVAASQTKLMAANRNLAKTIAEVQMNEDRAAMLATTGERAEEARANLNKGQTFLNLLKNMEALKKETNAEKRQGLINGARQQLDALEKAGGQPFADEISGEILNIKDELRSTQTAKRSWTGLALSKIKSLGSASRTEKTPQQRKLTILTKLSESKTEAHATQKSFEKAQQTARNTHLDYLIGKSGGIHSAEGRKLNAIKLANKKLEQNRDEVNSFHLQSYKTSLERFKNSENSVELNAHLNHTLARISDLENSTQTTRGVVSQSARELDDVVSMPIERSMQDRKVSIVDDDGNLPEGMNPI